MSSYYSIFPAAEAQQAASELQRNLVSRYDPFAIAWLDVRRRCKERDRFGEHSRLCKQGGYDRKDRQRLKINH